MAASPLAHSYTLWAYSQAVMSTLSGLKCVFALPGVDADIQKLSGKISGIDGSTAHFFVAGTLHLDADQVCVWG